MIILYLLATILTVFVGFRDGAGRNGRIRKRKYYRTCILRALGVGQVFLISLVALAYISSIEFGVVEDISKRCVPLFALYTLMVLLTFVPYLIPNWEIKSLVTVLVFGPLTLFQPIVIVCGLGYGMYPFIEHSLEILFVSCGGVFCLLFEHLLDMMGWAKRDAEV